VSADDPLIGTEVSRFRIERLLGRGGMGRVYLGVQPAIGSRVAIKVLAQEYADNADLLERFFGEARAVNLIRHENIVDIIDLDRLPDGRPFIVMEFLEGKTLRDAELPLAGILHAMVDVLLALHAAHAVGIIHRDLKPDNVIVSPSGRATVLDFGIAKLVGGPGTARTATGIALGTPHYMSPEQIQGEACDARADVYAAGVMLYELAAGQRPFEANSDFALMEAHVRTPPPRLPPEVPPDLVVVIERALAKRPADRWATARDMAVALREVAVELDPEARPIAIPPAEVTRSNPTVAAKPSALAKPPAPAPRGSRSLVIALAVVVVGLGAGLTFALVRGGDGTVARDAAVVAIAPVDAGADAAVPIDAAVVPDAAISVAIDAGAPKAKTTAAPHEMYACKVDDDCPTLGCSCEGPYGGWFSSRSCEPGRGCRFGAEGCKRTCAQRKLKYVSWRVDVPRTDADCRDAPNCKDHGDCRARLSFASQGVACVKRCAELFDCRINGLCSEPTDPGSLQCIAASDADCARGSECATRGRCTARDGKCVVSEASCRSSSSCTTYGACTVAGDQCEERSDADCAQSARCTFGGKCIVFDRTCRAADAAACAGSRACKQIGTCGFRESDHDCIATVEGCKASDECANKGRCRLAAGACNR